jgi:hypothetical protein
MCTFDCLGDSFRVAKYDFALAALQHSALLNIIETV